MSASSTGATDPSSSSCGSGSISCSELSSIYIVDLDRTKFFVAFLAYGIPTLICALIGGWALRRAHFKIRLLPSVITGLTFRGWFKDDKSLERQLAWLCLFIITLSLLPSLFILLWGISVYININHLLGFALFLILMSLQFTLYGFGQWRVNGWRLDRAIAFCFFISIVAMWTFEIWTIYLQKPYTYFNLSVVWIGYNMIPMTLLTYMMAATMAKKVEEYELLGSDPVTDYHAYMKSSMEAQKIKLEQMDKKPSGPEFVAAPAASSSASSAPTLGAVVMHLPGNPIEDKPAQNASVDSSSSSSQQKPSGAAVADQSSAEVAAAGQIQGGIKPPQPLPIWKPYALYVVALWILLAYSISVSVIKDGDGFGNLVGWVTSGTIICLDSTVWLCVYAGKISSPLTACLYQGLCRIILIVFGDVYWFVGHSFMYVVLAVFFGQAIVDAVVPSMNAAQQKASAVSDLMSPSSASSDAPSSSESLSCRYSDQLGSGFVERGRFASTRFGHSLLHHLQYYAFSFLSVAFLVDLIVCGKTSTVPIELTHSHPQYLVGILAIFLTGVILTCQGMFRMYANRDFRVDWKLVFACLIQWMVCCGCGGFLYGYTKSVILISLFVFLPPIIHSALYASMEWIKNDFQLYIDGDGKPLAPGASQHKVSEEAKDPSVVVAVIPSNDGATELEEKKENNQSTPQAVPSPQQTPASPSAAGQKSNKMNIKEIDIDLGSMNPIKKYRIIFCFMYSAFLTIGMGSNIAAHSDPPYIGYSIMAVMLIIACTAIPIIEWFNSFEISKNMIVQLFFTTVFFIAFILIFWIQGLEKANNNKSLALLFVLFMYPTFVVLLFALIKWRDDKWQMSRFVKMSLLICCVLITTFLIVVAVVYKPMEIGAVLLVGFYIMLFGSFIIPILTRRFPWLVKWSILAGIVVLIAFAAGVGSQPHNGFIGFSLAWGILFCVCSVSAYQSHRNTSQTGVLSHLYSPNIFPVFMYDTTPGIRNPLRPDDSRVYMVYLALALSMVWGILAVFFLDPAWIGLAIHVISIVLMILYALEAGTKPRILLAKAVRFLGEGSVLYKDSVTRAKAAAFHSQLVSIKATSMSMEQNLDSAVGANGAQKATQDKEQEEKQPAQDGKGAQAAGGEEEQKVAINIPASAAPVVEEDPEDLLMLDDEDLKLLGLNDASRPLTELDFQQVYHSMIELRKATPWPSLMAAFQGDAVQVTQVTYRGQQLTRRRCHELLLKLDHHASVLHSNVLQYMTQIQVELILAVETMKQQHEAEIMSMLRDTGHGNLTIDYIRGLQPSDPDRRILEQALLDWKKKQVDLLAARAKKRAEEEAATRIRDEEDRVRAREEEQKLIRARQDQLKLDEADAIKKQQELRRREEAERQQKEDDEFRLLQQKQLEHDRVAREAAEAERRQQEALQAAALRAAQQAAEQKAALDAAAALKAAEEARAQAERMRVEREAAEQASREAQTAQQRADAQKQADLLRAEQEKFRLEQAAAEKAAAERAAQAKKQAEEHEREVARMQKQQEEQRKAEQARKEAEQKKIEQLAAEQALRDAALAVEKALQAKVAHAISQKCCTLKETGNQFVSQRWYKCETCTSPNNEGCCEVCKDVCHSGHRLVDQGVSSFYCDCGKSGCEAATGIKPGQKGKPTLQQIEAQCAASGSKWTDPDFPPSAASLFRNPADTSKHQPWKELQWKRVEELRGVKQPQLFDGGADPHDIQQGALGDCWLLSAMSVMTQRQDDFQKIFVSKSHTDSGVYAVNFIKNGELTTILIDSFFPADKWNRPSFGHSAKENELWVMVLEKAYAKLHRNYESIESGFVEQALTDLCGAIGSRIDMSKDPSKQQTLNGVLFKQLLSYKESGFLLGAGSPAGSDSEANASTSGIVQGHAYAILDVQEVDDVQLIRLRNPWGRKEWTGDWSDNSDKWTRRMKAKLNWVSADDGAFWMSMTDFAHHFEEVYCSRFFDSEKGWQVIPPIRGEWKGPTAGGCTNYDSVKDNPQYLLTISGPTTLVMNLGQTDCRGTSEKLKPISLEVYNNKGQRITRTRTGPLVCSNPDSYIFRREVSIEHTFTAQKEPYTVVLSTFNQNEETQWTLSIFTTATIGWAEAGPAPVKAKK